MIVLGYGRLVDGSRRKVLSEDSSQYKQKSRTSKTTPTSHGDLQL